MQCTEHVTKCIQALCKCLLTGAGREESVSCADNIRYAVTNLIGALQMVTIILIKRRSFKVIVFKDVDAELIRSLQDTVQKLQVECSALQVPNKNRDESQIEFYVAKIKECAYNIAKDTKEIVTKYTSQ